MLTKRSVAITLQCIQVTVFYTQNSAGYQLHFRNTGPRKAPCVTNEMETIIERDGSLTYTYTYTHIESVKEAHASVYYGSCMYGGAHLLALGKRRNGSSPGFCLLAVLPATWGLSSPTRDGTQAPCTGSMAPKPLDEQGMPSPEFLNPKLTKAALKKGGL